MCEVITITEKFAKLDEEKQQRILDAAMKEFAQQGYEKASTNQMVKDAGIGKGMLFYYFKSKKDLFQYLVEYGVEFIKKEYLSKIDESEQDFIERYRQAAQIKLQVYNNNPHPFNFLGDFVINDDEMLTERLKDLIFQTRQMGIAKVFGNVDASLFRDDLPQDKIYKLIIWTMEGYEKDLIKRIKGKNLASVEIEPLWNEFFETLDLLKKVYYKK
ncbi:TetR/AcrR family transcriptional regulator [Proteinivorax hydrogeniformans]|uniref:TetR/AcrR family transcriptional regulator n=1 Tax=Proteinivorax hydrogeniformans TaxID=1826727 RepID=A0AAU8HR04_9FIRM